MLLLCFVLRIASIYNDNHQPIISPTSGHFVVLSSICRFYHIKSTAGESIATKRLQIYRNIEVNLVRPRKLLTKLNW